jgi:hypothetical protein
VVALRQIAECCVDPFRLERDAHSHIDFMYVTNMEATS